MYNTHNVHDVLNGATHTWTLHGMPGQNAGLPLVLKTTFVVLPDGQRGFAIDVAASTIPEGVTLLKQPVDAVEQGGQTVWVTSGNGLDILFEDNVYILMKAQNVADDGATGVMYYHAYPPVEFGGGDIVYDDSQFLESMAI